MIKTVEVKILNGFDTHENDYQEKYLVKLSKKGPELLGVIKGKKGGEYGKINTR